MPSNTTSDQIKNPTGIILKLVKDLARELRATGGDFSHVTLDSSLEKDLGFDSLARVELLARIGQAFGVNLPERALVECETPRDFLRYVYAAENGLQPVESEKVLYEATPSGEMKFAEVDSAETLIDVLTCHLKQHPARTHIIFLDENDRSEELSYEELWHGSLSVAAALSDLGVAPGRSVAIMLPTGLEYFCCFMGTLLCGAVPVPLYPPVRAAQIEEHLLRHTTILRNCLANSVP
ncbi:MAG: AMP-binding protein, partial [Desulfobulbaceae bacterium]|nr:AMP-binding protein [Desulfobulbaceae bacterium]